MRLFILLFLLINPWLPCMKGSRTTWRKAREKTPARKEDNLVKITLQCLNKVKTLILCGLLTSLYFVLVLYQDVVSINITDNNCIDEKKKRKKKSVMRQYNIFVPRFCIQSIKNAREWQEKKSIIFYIVVIHIFSRLCVSPIYLTHRPCSFCLPSLVFVMTYCIIQYTIAMNMYSYTIL